MLGNRWPHKPPLGYEIDFEHPLAQGLVAAWVFNEGTGTPAELVRGRPASAAASFAWGSNASGPTGTFNGSSTSLEYADVAATGATLSLAGSCTLGAVDLVGVLIERSPFGSSWGAYYDGTSGFRWYGASTSGNYRCQVPESHFAAGRRFAWGVTDSGTTGAAGANGSIPYLGGVPQATGGSSYDPAPVASSAPIYIGSSDGAGNYVVATMDYIFLWTIVQPPAAMAAIAADPWQIFGPRRAPALAPVAAAAAAAPPVPGTITVGRISQHSVVATATAATGGVGAVAVQWQYQWPRDGRGWRDATGPGAASLSATVEDLGPAAHYRLRVRYTDSAGHVAYSPAASVNTLPRRYVPRRCRPAAGEPPPIGVSP